MDHDLELEASNLIADLKLDEEFEDPFVGVDLFKEQRNQLAFKLARVKRLAEKAPGEDLAKEIVKVINE